jgi:hypothetical protein
LGTPTFPPPVKTLQLEQPHLVDAGAAVEGGDEGGGESGDGYVRTPGREAPPVRVEL